MPSVHQPTTKRIQKHIERIIDIANDDGIDDRKTAGQLHAIICEILDMEPAAHIATVIALAQDAKSKLTLTPYESIKAAEILHYMVYPNLQPTSQVRGKKGNQFQLEFAWADPVEEPETIEGEKVE